MYLSRWRLLLGGGFMETALLTPNRNPTCNGHYFVDILGLTIGQIPKYGFWVTCWGYDPISMRGRPKVCRICFSIFFFFEIFGPPVVLLLVDGPHCWKTSTRSENSNCAKHTCETAVSKGPQILKTQHICSAIYVYWCILYITCT